MKKLLLILLCLPFIGFGQINGCTDSLACNYYSLATIDDSSCYYHTTSTTSISICDSLIWNGTTYDSTGVYTNFSNSAYTTLTSSYNTAGTYTGVAVSGNYAYVGNGSNFSNGTYNTNVLQIIDISIPSSIIFLIS